MPQTNKPVTSGPLVALVETRSDTDEQASAENQGYSQRVRVVHSSQEALRLAQSHTVGLWVVPLTIAPAGAFDLLEMIRAEDERVAVVLVCDEHHEDELSPGESDEADAFLQQAITGAALVLVETEGDVDTAKAKLAEAGVPEDMVDGLVMTAGSVLAMVIQEDKDPREIFDQLIQDGMSEQNARDVLLGVSEALNIMAEEDEDEAQQKGGCMGAIILVVGIAVFLVL